MALSDPFFHGIASRIRWAIQDMNRNELKAIDDQYDLKRLLAVLLRLGYITKAESRKAKFYNGHRINPAHVRIRK